MAWHECFGVVWLDAVILQRRIVDGLRENIEYRRAYGCFKFETDFCFISWIITDSGYLFEGYDMAENYNGCCRTGRLLTIFRMFS